MIQNKHIIRFSFISLFVAIIFTIILYRYFIIEEVIVKQVTQQNFHISEIYKNVWSKHRLAVEKLNKYGHKAIATDQNFIDFAQSSVDFFDNVNANIILYDKNGNKSLVSNEEEWMKVIKHKTNKIYHKPLLALDQLFLKKYRSDQPLKNAFLGQTEHVLVTRAIITNEYGTNKEISFISSYIPIINTKGGLFKIEGVLQMNSNITEQWENITYLEQLLLFKFIIIFLIFFVIVIHNTNYAQSIINKQYETNRDLIESKAKAESESLAKTEFLANISHELRTPLNAIIGFSEIMIAETYGVIHNKNYKDYVNDINQSGKHLLNIINDILDFSKAVSDKLPVDHVELDLNKLSSSIIRLIQPRADQSSVKLLKTLPQNRIIIMADPKRLKQALLNLLSNAVKFTPPGGEVNLIVKKDDIKRKVYIIVADTGIGMSDEDIPKALSSFGQVETKMNKRFEGTGLGLPLTKKLVELMHGHFDIQSKLGNGTKVTLTFNYRDIINMV